MFDYNKKRLEFVKKGRVLLVGNPNTGKSVIFNYLTNQYVTVSNYPGTTIDFIRGLGRFHREEYVVIDTPGVNSLIAHSEDEEVTKDIIIQEEPKVIVQVIDSKNIVRGLNLTQELADLGVPLVLALNMHDEAIERGISIDIKKLQELFNVLVVETTAVSKEGLPLLKEYIFSAKEEPYYTIYDRRIEEAINKISEILGNYVKYKRFISILIICGDNNIFKLLNLDCSSQQKIQDIVNNLQKEYLRPLREVIQSIRVKKSQELAQKIVSIRGIIFKKYWQQILNRLTLNPFSAIPLAFLIIIIMYNFVGKFAAGTVVDFLEEIVFGRYIIGGLKAKLIFLPEFIYDLFLGDYGLVSMGLTYALAIVLPIVSAFFLFFSILEDTGYLPRLSILLDRLFHPIGLNGKAVLPFVLGLGCDTMATLTVRTLDTKKERIITTLLLSLTVPCSAQLGVIMGILGAISLKAVLIWFIIIVFSGFFVGFLSSCLIKGKRSLLIQEIPPIRIPQFSNILLKIGLRLKWYLKEAVPLFIIGTFILFIMNKTGLLELMEKITAPFVVNILGLPAKATGAFIIGFLRRDYGAAGLFTLVKNGQMNNTQSLVSMVVITLFVPCIAQFLVTIRERGIKIALFIFSFTLIFAIIVGGILNYLLHLFSISL